MTSQEFSDLHLVKQIEWIAAQRAAGRDAHSMAAEIGCQYQVILSVERGKAPYRHRTLEQKIADTKTYYKKWGKDLTDEEALKIVEMS